MAFPGFLERTFDFQRDLAANDDRDWFEANRWRYERDWRDPALDFIAALAPGMDRMRPRTGSELRPS